MIRNIFKSKEYNDTGFSRMAELQGPRLLNKNGSFNVSKSGLSFTRRFSLFHEMINMSWFKFFFTILLVYTVINLAFTLSYLILGVENLGGTIIESSFDKLTEAFFFSTQTLTTVGYGRINPEGFYVNLVASFEALVGLMMFALVTGLSYGRFSRPKARFVFSEQAVIAPYENGKGLMFRLANARNSEMIEAQVEVILSWTEQEGEKIIRKFNSLKLERNKINFLASVWTVVHPIDEESPLMGITSKEAEDLEIELIIIVKAFDNSFNQSVNFRTSFIHDEIIWDQKFSNMYYRNEKGQLLVDLSRISNYEGVN